jgi:hypothetical protein
LTIIKNIVKLAFCWLYLNKSQSHNIFKYRRKIHNRRITNNKILTALKSLDVLRIVIPEKVGREVNWSGQDRVRWLDPVNVVMNLRVP